MASGGRAFTHGVEVSHMVQFGALLSSAGRRLDRLLVLAVVPFLVGLASPGNFARVAADTSTFRFGISFGFPSAVATAWDFVSLPNPGSGFTVYPPGMSPPQGIGLVVASAVLTGVLAALYLGAIRQDLLGDGGRASDSFRHVPALVGFELLVMVVVLGLMALALVSIVLVIPGLVAALYLAYRFYPTPYLVVLQDRGLGDALRSSRTLSARGGAYTSFFVRYLLAVAVVSLVATPLFTTSVAGALAGTALLAPVCVLFNAATMLFLADSVGPAERSAGVPGGWDPDARVVQSSSSNSPVDM